MPPTPYQDTPQPTRDEWIEKQSSERAKAIIKPHLPEPTRKEQKQ